MCVSAQRVPASKIVGALLVMVGIPPAVLVYVHFVVVSKGMPEVALSAGISSYVQKMVADSDLANPLTWSAVLFMAVWAAIVPLSLGGKEFLGPPTAAGHRAPYLDSAFRYYLLTTVLLAGALWSSESVGVTAHSGLYGFACLLTLFGLACSSALYAKGALLPPSPGEQGTTGSFVFDFYWGRELYPRIGRLLDLKMWAILFYGVAASSCVMLVCWKAQYERIGWNWAMATSGLLFLLYMLRVYWGYYEYAHSIDQMHDRTGTSRRGDC